MRIESIEMPCQDGHGHGQRQHPRDGARRPDQLAQRPDRILIPVPDRCHGDDGPPEGVRDGLDVRLGDAELCVVDGARVDEHTDEEDNEEEAELLAARLDRQDENLRGFTDRVGQTVRKCRVQRVNIKSNARVAGGVGGVEPP